MRGFGRRPTLIACAPVTCPLWKLPFEHLITSSDNVGARLSDFVFPVTYSAQGESQFVSGDTVLHQFVCE
jgi:hypothetical protein